MDLKQIWEWGKQRRIWSLILSIVSILLTYFGYDNAIPIIAAMAAAGGLSLWSYAKPKE